MHPILHAATSKGGSFRQVAFQTSLAYADVTTCVTYLTGEDLFCATVGDW
jgi:hypothetical protein